MTDALDRTTTYGYDADGNLITVTDPTDGTVTYSYTSENEVATIKDPTGGTVTYGYDLDGEETSVTDPNGFETTFSFNALGLVSGESAPVRINEGMGFFFTEEEPVATLAYNQDGDLLTATDGDNHTTSYSYNALNEETSVENGDGDTDGLQL